jgi:hypothetical protein
MKPFDLDCLECIGWAAAVVLALLGVAIIFAAMVVAGIMFGG